MSVATGPYREHCAQCDELRDKLDKQFVRTDRQQAELTKQKRHSLLGRVALGVALGMGASLGILLHTAVHARFSRPAPCVETTEIISHSDSERTCERPGTQTVTPILSDFVMVRCVCGSATP